MRRASLSFPAAFAVLAAVACLLPAIASGRSSGFVECQRPVRTGVEVYRLTNITAANACPVALALFKWEVTGGHEAALYGCKGATNDHPGIPFLKIHAFNGWKLTYAQSALGFRMSRGSSSFSVSGTDFPLNCF